MASLKLEDWAILDAVPRGHVYRAESGAVWYEPRFIKGGSIGRMNKYRVDKTVQRLVAAGLVGRVRVGKYELTDAGRAELGAKAGA